MKEQKPLYSSVPKQENEKKYQKEIKVENDVKDTKSKETVQPSREIKSQPVYKKQKFYSEKPSRQSDTSFRKPSEKTEKRQNVCLFGRYKGRLLDDALKDRAFVAEIAKALDGGRFDDADKQSQAELFLKYAKG